MGDLVGYARVSPGNQRLDLQLDALKAAGYQRVWSDTASGSLTERPELAQLFDHLRLLRGGHSLSTPGGSDWDLRPVRVYSVPVMEQTLPVRVLTA